MRVNRERLTASLSRIGGEKPTYVEPRDDGFVAFFASELAALRVAYHYRLKVVTCTYRRALGVWSVAVKNS